MDELDVCPQTAPAAAGKVGFGELNQSTKGTPIILPFLPMPAKPEHAKADKKSRRNSVPSLPVPNVPVAPATPVSTPNREKPRELDTTPVKEIFKPEIPVAVQSKYEKAKLAAKQERLLKEIRKEEEKKKREKIKIEQIKQNKKHSKISQVPP